MNVTNNHIMQKNQCQQSYKDKIQSFIKAMADCDIHISDPIIANGEIQRFRDKVRGDHNPNGWYRLNLSGDVGWGAFGHFSHKTGYVREKWIDRDICRYPQAERKKINDIVNAAIKESIRKEKEEREEALEEIKEILSSSLRIDVDTLHPYLIKKKIKPYGARLTEGNRLIIPIYSSTRKLISLQYIDEKGEKRFHPKTSPKDGLFLLNEIGAGTTCVCEGFATGASICEATGYRVAVAFSAENLLSVAQTIKRTKVDVIVCADNDLHREKNIGLEKAKDAAKITNSLLAVPIFKNLSNNPTDFNDLHVNEGIQAVKGVFLKLSRIKHECLLEFMQREFPPAEKIMSPWLETGTVNMIVAKQGVGKSLLTLHIAHAIASGKDIDALGWKVEKKCKVLYLDGELKAVDIQKNMNYIANNHISYELGTNFIISTSNDLVGTEIDLCEKEWQTHLDDLIVLREPGFIIIDNILTFFKSGNIFDRNFFEKVMTWIRKHLMLGISFLFIHHESKEGNTPYGTVSIIKNMCHVFALYRSKNAEEDEDDEDGEYSDRIKKTTFIMECIKDRQGAYPGAKCTIVTIETDTELCSSVIKTKSYKKTIKQQIIDIFNCEPISYKEIQKQIVESGRETPPKMSNISAILHAAYDNGFITRALAPWEEKNFIKNRRTKQNNC